MFSLRQTAEPFTGQVDDNLTQPSEESGCTQPPYSPPPDSPQVAKSAIEEKEMRYTGEIAELRAESEKKLAAEKQTQVRESVHARLM
eukprot:3871567-Pyramimonas_sp.AAC.1